MSKNNNDARDKHNEETLNCATHYRELWTDEELEELKEADKAGTCTDAAFATGRSLRGVHYARSKLALPLIYHRGPSKIIQIPLTLTEALAERERQLAAGVPYPTIIKAQGEGYVIIESHRGGTV